MSTDPIRLPDVAGQFYEGTAEELRAQIERCFLHRLGPQRLPQVNESGSRVILGLASPHAGFMFSGPPAAKGFGALAADGRPQTVVVVGPSHRRPGRLAATQTSGAWRTPLGDTAIDTELAEALIEVSDAVANVPAALQGEHSLEVQLPFLQYVYGPTLRLVPVMMLQQDWSSARAVGEALAHVLDDRDAVVVASTDMTHYEPAETAKRRDKVLIDRMLALDPEGLCREAMRPGMSMCGFGPVAAMLLATRALGAVKAEVLAYSTSGDMQRMSDVVSYLSLSVSR